MKKGFTLVEIILSIGLVVIIGTISIFSFNIVKKNNKEKTLNNMSDEILTALRLYIETNKESKDRIYRNQEGMAITLNTLQNEGLIDFKDIDVSDNKDYVVAMLSQESGCSDILTVESWNLTNGPLHICSKVVKLSDNDDNNLTFVDKTPKVYYGENPRNIVLYEHEGSQKLYRIMYIDIDGSLILYTTESSFNGVFPSNTLLDLGDSQTNTGKITRGDSSSPTEDGIILSFKKNYNDLDSTPNGIGYEIPLSFKDFTIFASYSTNERSGGDAFLIISSYLNCTSNGGFLTQFTVTCNGTKIRLKPCMKITGGTGSNSTPFILENKCTSI